MTRVFLIKAGPTQWDLEKRISGNLTLPLAEEARADLQNLVSTLPKIDAVYHCASNEACHEVAKLVASRDKLRPRDNAQGRPTHGP